MVGRDTSRATQESEAGASVATRSLEYALPARLSVSWGAHCAERALPAFELAVPGDERPRRALELARAWLRGQVDAASRNAAAPQAHPAIHLPGRRLAILSAEDRRETGATASLTGRCPVSGKSCRLRWPGKQSWPSPDLLPLVRRNGRSAIMRLSTQVMPPTLGMWTNGNKPRFGSVQ